MPGRVAYDTNLLVYAEGAGELQSDVEKRVAAIRLLNEQMRDDTEQFVPAQTLIELHDVLVRKRRLDRDETFARVKSWAAEFTVIATSADVLDAAMTLSTQHRFRIFDAVILAAAASVGCSVLYSEDLQHGFAWHGTEIVNPFR